MYSFKLATSKICSCGKEHTMLPREFRNLSDGDPLDGAYWECECKSTLFTPHTNIDTTTEACSCHDCEDSETPCFYIDDCNMDDSRCSGCLEEAQAQADREFDERSQLGYL